MAYKHLSDGVRVNIMWPLHYSSEIRTVFDMPGRALTVSKRWVVSVAWVKARLLEHFKFDAPKGGFLAKGLQVLFLNGSLAHRNSNYRILQNS